MSTDTASPDPALREALGRCQVYADLAQGFAYPTAQTLAWLDQRHSGAPGRLERSLREARRAAAAAGLENLQRSFMRVFDPRNAPFPLEAENRPEYAQQRTSLLSDVMAFYRAFGVIPDRQRPDHLCCELEFLHVLSLKEARARRAGQDERADICADARRKFLAEHLRPWVSAVVKMVRARAHRKDDGFYLKLVQCLQVMMEEERESAA
ncbi:MAG: molecular chaperone TorD family protein [Planctomycetes bacterium]|nr:molecular chaperone TorD family protein [Planctomycetota bacterium]